MKENDVFGGFINAGDVDDKGALPPMNAFQKILDASLPLADVQKSVKKAEGMQPSDADNKWMKCPKCGHRCGVEDCDQGSNGEPRCPNCKAVMSSKEGKKIEKKEDFNDMGRVDKPKPIGKKGVRIEKAGVKKSVDSIIDKLEKGGKGNLTESNAPKITAKREADALKQLERDMDATQKESKAVVKPEKEKAALKVRKAMAVINKEQPMSNDDIHKALGTIDGAPDILKEDAASRPSMPWFEHAMGRASLCSDAPLDFVLKIWYGDTKFEKAKKAEAERKGLLGTAAGAGIGAAVGGIPGAMIGGGAGSMLGKSGDVTKAWEEAEYIKKVSNVLGTAGGAGIGAAVGGVPGAIIGGVAGNELTKPKASPIAESSEEAKMEKDLKGALAGGVVGGMTGGAAGAIEGAKIGHMLTNKPEAQKAGAPAPQAPQAAAKPVEKSADINKISRGAAAALGAGVGGLALGPLGAAGGAYIGHKLGKDKPATTKPSAQMNVKAESADKYPTVRSHKAEAKSMIKAKCSKIVKDMAGNESEVSTNQLGRAFVQSIIEIAGSGDISKSAEALGELAEEMLEKGLLDGGESSESSEGIGLMDKAVAEPYDNTKIIPKKDDKAAQEEDRVSSGSHLKVKDLEPSKKDVSH